MRHNLSTITAASSLLTLVTALSAPAYAQTYLPAKGGRAENILENDWLGGQRSDLLLTMEKLEWQSSPCPNAEPEDDKILEGCTFEIHIDWKSSGGYRQSERSDETDGADQFVFKYQGQSRWNLESVTRDGASVLGGANPEGEEANEAGGGGVRITPPEEFESSSGDGAKGVVYKYNFSYSPIGNECKVVPLRIRGTYRHTYDGPTRFWVGNTISVGVSFPWGVSAGGSASFINNYMWSKELFDSNGTEHWKALEPEDVVAQEIPCCGSSNTYVAPPPLPPQGEVYPGGGHYTFGGGDQFRYSVIFPGGKYGLTSTEIEAASPGGQLLGTSSIAFDSPISGLVADLIVVDIPVGYAYKEILLSATAVTSDGTSSHLSQTLAVLPAYGEPSVNHQTNIGSQETVLVGDGFAPGSTVVFYTYTPQLLGDLDFDLDVDADDLARFEATAWAPTSDLDDLHADLDLNGDVDEADLAILLANLGTSEKGSVPVPGCPEMTVELPALASIFGVADEQGHVEVTLDEEVSHATRLIYGAVEIDGCAGAGPVNRLNR